MTNDERNPKAEEAKEAQMSAILAGANKTRIIEAEMDFNTMAIWFVVAVVVLGTAGMLFWWRRRREASSPPRI